MEKKKDQAELMADLTYELNQTCHEKEQYFASSFNLTTAEFRCLRVFRDKKRLPVKDICNAMKLSAGRVTHIITTLEKKNFVIREIDPNDRRGITVVLTSNCQPLIRNLNAGHVKLHADILSGIEPDKRESVIIAMQELVKALKIWSDNK